MCPQVILDDFIGTYTRGVEGSANGDTFPWDKKILGLRRSKDGITPATRLG